MNALEKILVDLALNKQYITQVQLDRAFDIQKTSPMKNFGRILAELGFVTEKQLDELKIEADLVFRGKSILPNSTANSVSVHISDDYSPQIEETPVKRYSKPRQSDIINDPFGKNDSDRLIGTEFVGCRILEKLGQGGMGKIYKVKHLFLNKFMAMKILSRQHTEQKQFVQRFFREARSAAKLNHPNIVKMYDVGQTNGEYYMLMQLVDGIDLKKVIEDRGRMSVRDALFIVAEVAKALAEAHSQKIIHRDIKPDNIMINKYNVLVTDFGLAKIEKGIEDGSDVMTITGPGQVLGSPYFMAPEQADSNGKIDPRTDIYSLGSTFYYLITGRYPYDAPNAIAIIFKRVNEPLIRPQKINPMIPNCINKLIIKMMAIHQDKRPDSAKALLREIDELPLKNKITKFNELDFKNNVDIDEANKLFARPTNTSEVTDQVETSRNSAVSQSKAKTKIKRKTDFESSLTDETTTPGKGVNSNLMMFEEYSRIRKENNVVFEDKKDDSYDEFTPMTDFFEKEISNYKNSDEQTIALGKTQNQQHVTSDSSASFKAPILPRFSSKKDEKESLNDQQESSKVENFSSTPDSEATSELKQARILFDEKKYAQSLGLYKDILKKYPDNEFAKKQTTNIEHRFVQANQHYRNAQKFFQEGQIEKSVNQLKESLRFLPGNSDIVKFLNTIIQSNTEVNKILNNAYNLFKTGKITEAIQKANESYKFVKNHPKTMKLIEKLQKVLDKRSV